MLCESDLRMGQDITSNFESGTLDTMRFEMGLTKLMSVIGGFAKSIACLESSHTTLADVILHWLGNLALLHQLFNTKHDFRDETVHEICRIINYRYDEIINQHKGDLYFAAFFLHPGLSPLSDTATMGH
jgi:hypothetical protein